jgi:hypothetical protein
VFFCTLISFQSGANPLASTQPYLNQTPLQPHIVRDPFTPSDLMYEIAGTIAMSSTNNGFMRSEGGVSVPKMKLKGYVGSGDADSFALLEIEGAGTFMVKEGDEINYNPRQPRSAIRITRLDRSSVTIETGLIGTFKVQR